MYSHVIKGFTVGHIVVRKLLRFTLSLPGTFLDSITSVFFPAYKPISRHFICYPDGVRAGYCEGVLGWIGESVGYVVGGLGGMIIGCLCYIPDAFLRLCCFIHEKVSQDLSSFAMEVGQSSLCDDFYPYREPNNFFKKAWNLSAATVGLALATLLWGALKFIELIFPVLGNDLSKLAWKAGGSLGSVVTWAALSLPLYLVSCVTRCLVMGYQWFREQVQSAMAFLYATGKEEPYFVYDNTAFISNESVHSNKFREKVKSYQSQTNILRGLNMPLDTSSTDSETKELKRVDASTDVIVVSREVLTDILKCPINSVPSERSVVATDGYTYDETAIKQWLKLNPTSPMTRESMLVGCLIPNRMVNDLVKALGLSQHDSSGEKKTAQVKAP